MEELIPIILIVVVVLIVVFLIFREIFCWYWKINDQITLQTENNRLLKNILEQLKKTDSSRSGEINSSVLKKRICSSCGKENDDSNAVFCYECGNKLTNFPS